MAARQRDHLMAARPDGGRAGARGRSRLLFGACGGFRRRPLDPDGGNRGGGAGGCALGSALRTLPLAAGAYLRGEDSIRNAQGIRRAFGTEGVKGLAAIVVMGVSGAGKSTVGRVVAERLRCPFRDADNFHPPANIEKMS